jgi:chromate reductase
MARAPGPGKPAGLIGMSVGALGTAMAQQHLRNILAYLDMPTLGQPEMFIQNKTGFFDASGAVAGEDTKKFLQKFLDRFAAFVKEHADKVANR